MKDDSAQIDTILWTVSGKIKTIKRIGISTLENLTFDYDASGNRIAKHEFNQAGNLLLTTYYVRDAQGNIMSGLSVGFTADGFLGRLRLCCILCFPGLSFGQPRLMENGRRIVVFFPGLVGSV